MRVVTYARVSTEAQKDKGQSLVDQERAFAAAVAGHGWKRVAAYAESASGKDVGGRETFQKMLDDLPKTKPEILVIATLDRFTRDATDGLMLIRSLRGKGIRLLPLDWDRADPIDLDNDRDWDTLYSEFGAAERERRRIAKRARTAFAGRRARGATTVNLAPFGLKKEGDRLVPGPDAEMIAAIDARYLAGEEIQPLMKWALEASAGRSWTSRSGFRRALLNNDYVAAGVRTVETAAALASLIQSRVTRHGMVRKHDHEFTGVFSCAQCGNVMGEQLVVNGQGATKERLPAIVCQFESKIGAPHRRFSVRVDRVRDAWHGFIASLSGDAESIRLWEASIADSEPVRASRSLERQIGMIDAEEARLAKRRDTAFDLLDDPTPAVKAQARKMLTDVERDEGALHAQREALRGEIVRVATDTRTAAGLREALALYAATYDAATTRQKNQLNRALCTAVGSHPVVERMGTTKWATLRITWPAVSKHPVIVPAAETKKRQPRVLA